MDIQTSSFLNDFCWLFEVICVYMCVYMHFRSLYCCNISFGKKKGVSTVLWVFFSFLYWPELCYQVLGEFVEYDRCQWFFFYFPSQKLCLCNRQLAVKMFGFVSFFSLHRDIVQYVRSHLKLTGFLVANLLVFIKCFLKLRSC